MARRAHSQAHSAADHPATAANEALQREEDDFSLDLEVGDYEHGYGDEDEDDYGPGVVIYAHDDDQDEEPPQSDLADATYLDPLALVNAWEGALADLKDVHQERFLPPTEAPLSLGQKQAKAPFWYGPPASEASTSKLPHPAADSALPSAFSASVPLAGDTVKLEEVDVPPLKKRKRLTGSQKKARKAAKLTAGSGAAHSTRGATYVGEEEEDDDGPTWQPDSPPHVQVEVPQALQSVRGPAGPSQPTTTTAPTVVAPSFPAFPPAPPLGARPPPGSAPANLVIPPVASLPSSFPAPPTITPLTGTEAPLDPETPEQLLEAALWSWFTAGYQTALLHAAAGVARFAPSRTGGEE